MDMIINLFKFTGMTVLEGCARLFAFVCFMAWVLGPFIMIGVLGLLIQRTFE